MINGARAWPTIQIRVVLHEMMNDTMRAYHTNIQYTLVFVVTLISPTTNWVRE